MRSGLSAGRVQSVAVKLLVEREREIRNFVPDESWKIMAKIGGTTPMNIELVKIGGKSAKYASKEDVLGFFMQHHIDEGLLAKKQDKK